MRAPGRMSCGVQAVASLLLACSALLILTCTHGAAAFASRSSNSSSAALRACLQKARVGNFTVDTESASFESLLDASRQNTIFAEPGVRQPSAIILPGTAEEVQAAYRCARAGQPRPWTVRVRSGGHSYEGLSYTADSPFVLIDFLNMRAVRVDLGSETAWVESGANLGEVYASIAQTTSRFGFAAGVCPAVGAGGHFSGGGYGFLTRKYGVSADNILDAVLVDAKGNILNRSSMGEEHFWALRGGGGGSWGIVVSWKIRLLPVPERVTQFSVVRVGRDTMAELVYKWQFVAPSAPKELEFTANITGGPSPPANGTAQVRMFGQYLGTIPETVSLLGSLFPELNVTASDCQESSWIDAVVAFGGASSRQALFGRYNRDKGKFKAKSDYATRPIPKHAWATLGAYLEKGPISAYVYLEPYGGAMAEIPSDAVAFAHRAGTLYIMQYQTRWSLAAEDSYQINYVRRLHKAMTPYVSQHPRAAYVNYIDLDLGTLPRGLQKGAHAVALAEASWGSSYWLNNFRRLVDIKTKVDPQNIFNHPQGVPPL